MENTTFPFDFPYPESESLKALLHSFSSESRPCALPRWYFLPPHFSPHYSEGSICNLGCLHDYIRLYLICNGSESRRFDRSESSCIDSCNTEHAGDWDGERDLSASKVARQTIDPNTGLCIDKKSWSMWNRWYDFTRRYEKAEEEYALRKDENTEPQSSY
ncbi:hypothetical protein BJ165DRAFT_1509549 [Panaeolus papilionaceus]|nr:hypothetical protein BJ165DRAFT_1509549 [Panaeolus papilionaceus]